MGYSVPSLQRIWAHDLGLPKQAYLAHHDNGEYSSESDFEETRHAMLATDHAANEEVHVTPGDADRYENLVVQRVLSTQVAQPEKNQRHTLFHTRALCRSGRFASSSTAAAATTWQVPCWSRSCHYPLVSIRIHITFSGLMMVEKLE